MKKGRKKRSFGRILGISLMAFALALSAVPAEGVIAEEGVQLVSEDSDFEIENGVLKKYNGSGGDVVIPAGVTEIGESAFSVCAGLTSVTIPDSVTKIDNWAFFSCINLTSVTIPDSVTEIGDGVFWGCGLTSVTIPNSVVSVGKLAFLRCSSLKEIEFPESVKEIGIGVICGCENLTNITILNKNVTLYGQYTHEHGAEIKYCILGEEDFAQATLESVYIPNNSRTLTFYGYSGSTTQEFAELLDAHKSEAELNTVTFIALDGGSSGDEAKNNVAAAIQEGNNPPVYNGYDSALISAIVNGVKGTPILRIEAGNDMIGGYISSNNLVDSQHNFDCVGYNLSLVDEAGNTVTEFTDCIVTLPLPTDWTDKNGTFWIGSIKPDGQFERITANVVDVQGQKCIQFTTNHFSEYGIVMETQKSQDQSDGTGDGDTGSGTGNGENNGGSDDSGSGNGSSGSGTGNGDSDSGSGSETGSSDSGSGSGSGTGSSDGGSGSDGSAGNSSNANSSDTTTNSNNASSSNSTAAVSQSSPSDMSYMPKTGIEDLLFLKNTLVYGTFFIGAILFILSFKKRRI